jgi:hypothetical protein
MARTAWRTDKLVEISINPGPGSPVGYLARGHGIASVRWSRWSCKNASLGP